LKKVFTILILSAFVFSNTELHQIVGLPVLLEHFTDHKKTDCKISFIDFIKKHYSENNKTQDHNDEHKHLPFKTHDCSAVHSMIIFFELPSFDFAYNHFVLNKEKTKYIKRFNSSTFLSNIWQPPKVA
jgi:hypothetical protein